MLRAQMFKQGESPNRQKTAGCFFEKKIGQNMRWFLSEHRKTLNRRGFILKSTDRIQVSLKNGTKDFQNSIPFKRSAYFSMTITRDFGRFRYFKSEISFLKNENLFKTLF